MLGFLKKNKGAENGQSGNRRRTEPMKSPAPFAAMPEETHSVAKGPRIQGLAKQVLQFLLAAIVTAFMVFLAVAAYRHATSSDYFKFVEVEISGNDRLTREEILSAAGLTLGTNIFSTDVLSAKSLLLQNSWIENAEVVRRLPGKVTIRVTEHKARALVNFDVLYLVDDTGKVFKRWVRGDTIPSPVITGISREEYIQSPGTVEGVLCDAIDLAARYAAMGLERSAPLQEIYREPDMGFSLTVGEDPIYIKFGRGPYKQKLTRLSALLKRLAQENKRPGQIFFDNEIRPDRITVKLKREKTDDGVDDGIIQPNETKKIVSKI